MNWKTTIWLSIIKLFPFQNKLQNKENLTKKKKKHEGVAKSAPSNAIVAEEIETLLHNIAIDGQLIVDAHFLLFLLVITKRKWRKPNQ